MAMIKCKMCGGDLVLVEGQSVAECEYCGSRQTVPVADNEKKLTLFARANRLRASCEFDKAAGIYESIVADFPEEAEAYWGLVLCKYGIEYVDDPATGKKIPTCHRSSFDSIMDDANFEQALENADAVARKVYREEAKQIEEIRKGIIAVSSNEQPYDIFICYKETDENGERTLDSVLAQDIYDALTEKGYRTFFARITLEDKLGMEYEPYIFAALNSAKIMLAIGTDYEYYNAVWVKNEWSRYLKLMASDKTKHLIPCYKGIDAYDMPKEFARLQAQDLGKVGAMQDLLRGIEKILPKAAPVTVVQERVVVGGSGDNKIASLLDRGNMALEDGDWTKADSFFEDVLNNDSKNAQAYIGKTLALERCRTLDALIRKRMDVSQNAKGKNLQLQPDQTHIDEIVQKYSLPGYVQPEEVHKLFSFDLSYHSNVTERKQQYQSEESWWNNHKQLSRAEKFAAGDVAEDLTRKKKALFVALSDRVRKAEAAEAAAKKDMQKKYEAFLRQADEAAQGLYNDGCARREADYQKWAAIAKTSSNIGELHDTEKCLNRLDDYADSRQYAALCRKRVAEEQARLDAEAERQREIAEQKKKAQQKKNKTITIIAAAAVAIVIIAALLVTKVIIPGSHYKAAEELLAAGDYAGAVEAFGALGAYKDAPERVLAAYYAEAEALFTAGDFDDAAEAFAALGEYEDAAERVSATYFTKAQSLLAAGDDTGAAIAFGQAGDYQDAKQQSMDLWNTFAVRETVGAGSSHTVGLKPDGTVVAVGGNYFGQCDVSGWKDIVAISADSHTVGLKSDGTVVAVGANGEGQCKVSDWIDIVAISAGAAHTVGLKADGTVMAVGWNRFDQCDVSGWKDIVAISTGYHHTVGLKADGTVVAVGYNGAGQCDVSDWRDIVAISAGDYHTVGLKADGTVVAVGANMYNQCDVSGWRDIVAISAGAAHTVGLKADGTVVAVGLNEDGQCDVSGWKDIVAISAGEYHTIGLKADGTVVAVGNNEKGQCNVSGWTDIMLPVFSPERQAAVDAAKQAQAEKMEAEYAAAEELLAAGDYAGAAIAFSQAGDYLDAPQRCMECWDAAAVRETVCAGAMQTVCLKSDGTVMAVGSNMYNQCDVSGWKNIVAVSATGWHTVGLKSDGTVMAVGSNMYNQCDVSGWENIVAISAGGYHTVGLKSDGTVVAVGKNEDGQCDVSGWENIVAVSAGLNYTVGLKSDGTVVAVGYSDDGECDVSSWRDIVAVSAGVAHTIGLKSDGTVVAVGNNDYGQCDVSNWTGIVAISAGDYHTVGLKSDGTVVAVGHNKYGQCNVSSWRGIVAISAGGYHTVGLKSDGTVVAVGNNDYGKCDVSSWTDIKLPW